MYLEVSQRFSIAFKSLSNLLTEDYVITRYKCWYQKIVSPFWQYNQFCWEPLRNFPCLL